MGKKHKNLFQQIITPENLKLAYFKTSKGKRKTRSYREFSLNAKGRLKGMRRSLVTRQYRQGKPRLFVVHEPKTRLISALPFRDRVVQHAVNNIIEPIFDKVFLPQSYACRSPTPAVRARVHTRPPVTYRPNCAACRLGVLRFGY